jgi:hypothetical protein
MPSKVRSLSKADRDPEIIDIKQLRDSRENKELAGLACKGLYKCYNSENKQECLEKIKVELNKLPANSSVEGGSSKKKRSKSKSTKSKSKTRSSSVTRGRSRSKTRK